MRLSASIRWDRLDMSALVRRGIVDRGSRSIEGGTECFCTLYSVQGMSSARECGHWEEVGVHWLGLSFSAGGHLVSVCASGGGVVRSDLVFGGEQS